MQSMAGLVLPFAFEIFIGGLLMLIISDRTSAGDAALEACTLKHFDFLILNCNPKTRKRKAIYFMNNKSPCDLKANNSIAYPLPVENLPCECKPGYGEQRGANGKIKCQKCQKGKFSHGGELIDNWRNWNGTLNIPGSGYNAYPYCSDFLTGKDCEPWKPGGNFEYLISGVVKNHTAELKCFEQSILVITRHFVGEPGENKIKFKYKVDGAPCRRGSTVCTNGLYFFVNGVRKLKKDVQFMWKEFSVDLKPGGNEFKFVYHRSCVKEEILDVAFIKHISLIGTASPNTICSDCPAGTYSAADGAAECERCKQGKYQDKPGQTSCTKCKEDEYSRIGATMCTKLPNCTEADYYRLPDHINTCLKNENQKDKNFGKWMRKRLTHLAEWTSGSKYPCMEDKSKKPPDDTIQCSCQPGQYLDVKLEKKPSCRQCKSGTYSDGTFLKCKTCALGRAAVPGFYIRDATMSIPKDAKISITCSGRYCNNTNDFWLPRGTHYATSRLTGNFEIKTTVGGIDVNYHDAKISYKCAVDCRMTLSGKRLAKHDHCFLKIIVMRGNEVVKAEDCVHRYRAELRNGSVQTHKVPLKKEGVYSFSSIFHHEDEGNYSLVSYQASVFNLSFFGIKSGSAKSCVVCPAGTRLSNNKNFCIKCPNGTFSSNASSKCTPCPKDSFADKEGSDKCTKCGEGTKSNDRKDGCDYQGCQFRAAEGVVYDLSPLRRFGGPMYKVKTYNKPNAYHFPLIYYVNICSHKHDNSSCMTYVRKMDRKTRKLEISETTFLRTMACKRWSFDRYHSYSIGEVLHFHPLKDNITGGLMINLTGGHKCFHKGRNDYVKPSTSILMECDLTAGVGQPEPRSNLTAIDKKHCHFELLWKSRFACPLCTDRDYTTVQSKCVNNSMVVRRTRIGDCHAPHGIGSTYAIRKKCELPPSQTPLIITIVIAVGLIGVLIVFVIYYMRRNRALRGRLFKKSFHKVQDEDEDELVDNMQPHIVS